MIRNAARGVAVACLLAACAATALGGTGQGGALSPAAQDLVQQYPGVQPMVEMDRVIGFYGKPMTRGATTDAAAIRFLDQHGDAFGAGALDLRLSSVNDVGAGKFDVFAYDQYIDGIKVELGAARVLVLKGADTNRVVYAAGKLARTPDGGFAADTVSADQALAIVRSFDSYKDLPVWSQPEMVIYFGEGDLPRWIDAVRAWKFTGEVPSLVGRVKLTFFVDAATGQILHARNEIHNTDVTGNVKAKVTPGVKPDGAGNPAVAVNLPDIRVAITGGSSGYTDANGNITLTNPGATAVTVSTTVGTAAAAGRWAHVVDQTSTAELALSSSVTPPGPFNFVLNNTPSALTTAQANAFIYTGKTRDFMKERVPSWTALDASMTCNVNIADTCNAFYDGASINFYQAGGGCANTSYASVIHHEYGHHIVNQLGLSQGSFGEGYGDCVGILIQDYPIVGEDFCGAGCHVRTPATTIVPTGCGQEIHYCGMTIGGIWWEIRQNLGAKYGSSVGLQTAQQLFVDWSMDTLGGSGNDSAVARTAIEVLTVNDVDGDIANGTPDYQQICAAFGTRSISCPPIQLIDFAYPDGVPSSVTPDVATNFRVNVVPLTVAPIAGSGQLSYRIDGGSFSTVSMTQTAPNEYTATLPGVDCLSKIDFYVSATATGGTVVSDPDLAPAGSYRALASTGSVTTFTDDFQVAGAWTTGPETATTGRWNRMDPQPTAAQPGDDHTPAPGTICWVTDGNAGSSIGDFDVDGGQTVLNSPNLDLSAYGDATISFWRWYSNDQGSNPGTKTFKIEVSGNGGTTWTRVRTVGPTGPGTQGGWIFDSFSVKDYVTPSATVKVRFIADDLGTGSGSIIEAAIDDFQVVGLLCDTASCPADLNGDGIVDFADYLEFLNLYDAGDLRVDFNGDGIVDFADYLEFLNLYDAGC
ncbi:MAG: hypothetical protein IT436_03630 [Phycisphaerales bacterium]|nr:hypothetical protein [Phycisphaerales bacterium]